MLADLDPDLIDNDARIDELIDRQDQLIKDLLITVDDLKQRLLVAAAEIEGDRSGD